MTPKNSTAPSPIRQLFLCCWLFLALLVSISPAQADGSNPGGSEDVDGSGKAVLTVGATLPVYLSWLETIGDGKLRAVAIVPSDVDPHVYQPTAEDLESVLGLDAVVENGYGHDAYLSDLLKAAGRTTLRRIRPAEGTALIRGELGWNGHSFLSFLGASQEILRLAEALAELDPAHGDHFRSQARGYVLRLRRILGQALARLDALGPGATEIPIGTVHDGYAYLFQELGLEIHAVVQPRHGVEPSAKQLADTIRRIREADIRVLFTEMDFDKKYVEVLERETGCKIARLTHITGGRGTAQRFESDMRANVDSVIEALGGDAFGDRRRGRE